MLVKHTFQKLDVYWSAGEGIGFLWKCAECQSVLNNKQMRTELSTSGKQILMVILDMGVILVA